MWMLTNAGLAIVIESTSGLETNAQKVETELRARQNAYFTFILWATFGLSAVRFIGVRPCVTILQRRKDSMLTRILCSACGTSSNATSSGYAAGNEGPCAMRKLMSGRLYIVLALPGVFRRHTITNPRPYPHNFNLPPGNRITQLNLTFELFRFPS